MLSLNKTTALLPVCAITRDANSIFFLHIVGLFSYVKKEMVSHVW
jgi:hypothetical protein